MACTVMLYDGSRPLYGADIHISSGEDNSSLLPDPIFEERGAKTPVTAVGCLRKISTVLSSHQFISDFVSPVATTLSFI